VTEQQFFPTAYRRLTSVPSYPGQAKEVVALRARPRDAYGEGAGEWAIWDTYAVTQSPTSPAHGVPTLAEVAELARDRARRTPGYELQLVRASLVADASAPV
jgi:hypothetical protein